MKYIDSAILDEPVTLVLNRFEFAAICTLIMAEIDLEFPQYEEFLPVDYVEAVYGLRERVLVMHEDRIERAEKSV